MRQRYLLLSLLMTAMTGLAHANDAAIQQSLKKLGLQQIDIQPSPLPGMKTVLTESGVIYITEDGKNFIQGPLYDVSSGKPVNATNKLLEKKVDALSSEMIVYKAAKEQHVITVFTDITCGYCHKLHSQMADYNALGITVRYLAFPREGTTGQVAKNMNAVWCAADRKKAFDSAMKGEAVMAADCNIDLSRQYNLGILYGIQGTPAILLQNGMLIPGYQGPQEMKKLLDNQKDG